MPVAGKNYSSEQTFFRGTEDDLPQFGRTKYASVDSCEILPEGLTNIKPAEVEYLNSAGG